jgi:hypothetical protein
MSYLLKALEKAEQERQQNLNPQETLSQPVAAHASLPKGLVVFVVILLAVTLWQVWPSNDTQSSQVMESDYLYSEVADSKASDSVTSTEQNSTQQVVEEGSSDLTGSLRVVSQQDASPKTLEPVEPVKIAPQAKDLSQLSAQELARIPSLNLASHIYSSAADFRSVVINDQTYKQGDLIEAGLILEEINQSGIVINIHGQKVALPKGISWVASQNVK